MSFYYHAIRCDDLGGRVPADVPLEEFVGLGFPEVEDDQTRRIAGDTGVCSKRTLSRAKDNIVKYFAVVGVTHRFDETCVLIQRTLGWSERLYWPRLVNDARPKRAEIDPVTERLIAERNELDCELFAFAEGLLEESVSRQGHDFTDQVRRFRERNAELAQAGSGVDLQASGSYRHDVDPWIVE
jgi:hypothetical protein